MASPLDSEEISDAGYIVLKAFFDPTPLVAEVHTAFAEGLYRSDAVRVFPAGTGTVTTQYLPMMGERTPVSLGLIDNLALTVTALLGRPVLPGRAKGSRYFGDSSWHRDSAHGITSIGCVAYLEPTGLDAGALRVIPGSHNLPGSDPPADCSGSAVPTDPGDVIVFDERLIHGSRGGSLRHQWRVDFVVDPLDERELVAARYWYEQNLPTSEPDAGYDPDLYPSWGTFWQSRERPWSASLRRLGLIP